MTVIIIDIIELLGVQPLLNDIHSNFFMPTIKFMSKIASASSFSCRSVVTEVILTVIQVHKSSYSFYLKNFIYVSDCTKTYVAGLLLRF